MLDSIFMKNWRKKEWWGFLVWPHFEIENENNIVSSSRQDETNKYLKYELNEPAIRFTYHCDSNHGPFIWRRIQPVVFFVLLQKWINDCFALSL